MISSEKKPRPILKPWAKMIAVTLKLGGFFYIADFHPTLWMLDDAMENNGHTNDCSDHKRSNDHNL